MTVRAVVIGAWMRPDVGVLTFSRRRESVGPLLWSSVCGSWFRGFQNTYLKPESRTFASRLSLGVVIQEISDTVNLYYM